MRLPSLVAASLALLLSGVEPVRPVEAAVVGLNFEGSWSVDLDSVFPGASVGTPYAGMVTYDDSPLTGSGTEILNAASFLFDIGGAFSIDLSGPTPTSLFEVRLTFIDGVLSGLWTGFDPDPLPNGAFLINLTTSAAVFDPTQVQFRNDLGFLVNPLTGQGANAGPASTDLSFSMKATTVPEPATLLLFAVGLAELFLVASPRRRREIALLNAA